jgi:hypothetical protein
MRSAISLQSSSTTFWIVEHRRQTAHATLPATGWVSDEIKWATRAGGGTRSICDEWQTWHCIVTVPIAAIRKQALGMDLL